MNMEQRIHWILDNVESMAGKVICMAIAEWEDGNHSAKLTYDYLSRRCDMSVPTVWRAIVAMRKAGVIEYDEGNTVKNVYRFVDRK